MDGLFQRGKMWHFRFTLRGKQERISLKTKDEAEAIRRARKLIQGSDESDEAKKITKRAWEREVNEYLADRVGKREMSKNAADSRRTVLIKFSTKEGITNPDEITKKVMEGYYRRLQKEIEEVTAQTYVRWVYTFLAHLDRARRLRAMPEPIKLDKARKTKRKQFCTRDQVRAIIQAAPTQELRFVLYCGFHCGMRREEISEARPEWFDMRNGLVHIQRSDTWEPKDRDDRTVPITQEFADFLERSYGFPSPFMIEPTKLKKGKWRYRYDFRRPFENLMAKLGLDWVTPHTMRRTFASLKVSAGVSLYKVSIWLGDLERVVQDHYGYLIPKDADIEKGI